MKTRTSDTGFAQPVLDVTEITLFASIWHGTISLLDGEIDCPINQVAFFCWLITYHQQLIANNQYLFS